MNNPTEKECLKDKGKKVWKFVHHTNFSYQTSRLEGRACEFDWLRITNDGVITVKGSHGSGYAWDGCTPKKNFLDITFGNFDGKLIKHDPAKFGKNAYYPMTYFVSMIHDVLYQYKRCGLYTRKEADLIFLDMVRETRYTWGGVYYFFIRRFGWIFSGWKFKNKKQVEAYILANAQE